jgi:hypothetical protein
MFEFISDRTEWHSEVNNNRQSSLEIEGQLLLGLSLMERETTVQQPKYLGGVQVRVGACVCLTQLNWQKGKV